MTLSTKLGVVPQGNGVRFDFQVVNATGKRVELNFASGQAYDFVVVDSAGREVWRWAEGRIFTQSVQNKLLGKGEGITIAERWGAGEERQVHRDRHPPQHELSGIQESVEVQ